MLGGIVSRLWLPASGLMLAAGVAVQSAGVPSWLPIKTGRPEKATVETPPPPRVVAEGRVVAYPGAEVVVGTEVSGLILSLPVQEKMAVRRGDPIAELRCDDLRASRAEAEARAEEAEADIRFYEREVRREATLIHRQAGTSQNLDAHRHALEASRARRAVALATRDRFDALIAKSRIVAPIDGVVIARHADPGEALDAGAPVVTIADLGRLRIEAEVDEYDTSLVALGQSVSITAEGYEAPWAGSVEEVPDAVVNRRLRPEDPGRPIDTRVLPVKITLAPGTLLKLGQRVEVAIEVGTALDGTR
jgi:HlyD family secretion protein